MINEFPTSVPLTNLNFIGKINAIIKNLLRFMALLELFQLLLLLLPPIILFGTFRRLGMNIEKFPGPSPFWHGLW